MSDKKSATSLMIIGFTILFWGLVAGLAYLCSFVQCTDLYDTGISSEGAFFSGNLFEYNTKQYVLGLAVFAVVTVALWWVIIRNLYDAFLESSVAVKIVCAAISLVGVVAVLLLALFGEMSNVYLNDDVGPGLMFGFTMLGWPLLTLALVLIGLFVRRSKVKFEKLLAERRK